MTKVSEAQFIPIQPQDGLIGFASIVWDKSIKLSGIGVHTTLDGDIRLVYPKGKLGLITFPINKEAGKLIKNCIKNKIELLFIAKGVVPEHASDKK